MNGYIVYAKADNMTRVVVIDSSAFLTDTAGWTQIDEGNGDRYMHAQGNYLPKPLMDEQGRYRYKLVDGAVVERTPEELAADVLPSPAPSQADINAANIDFLAMMTGIEL
jgi:hypothetical protein